MCTDLLAHPRNSGIVYCVLRHDVQDAAVFVCRGPERSLAERHVVEQVCGLRSARLQGQLTVMTVPSFAPVGFGSPIMAPFSNCALKSD